MARDPDTVGHEGGGTTCGWCGRPTPPDALICPHCGTEVSDKVTVVPGRHGPRVRTHPTFGHRPLPDLGARWWGRLVDGLLIGLPASLLLMFAFHSRGVVRALPVIVLAAYEGFCISVWGRTIGKHVSGTRVLPFRRDRELPTMGQAFVRASVMGAPSLLTLLPGAGAPLLVVAGATIWLPILLQHQRRGLPDLVAGTIVVRAV